MRIFFVTPEFRPIIKVTGVADLLMHLAREMGKEHEVSIIIPRYNVPVNGDAKDELLLEAIPHFDDHSVCAGRLEKDGFEIYTLGNHPSFETVKCDLDLHALEEYEHSQAWSFFSYAAHDLIMTLMEQSGSSENVVHCFGWTAGLLPALLKHSRREKDNLRIVTTVDILEQQGKCEHDDVTHFFNDCPTMSSGLEEDGTFNFLKSALMNSDMVGTVSPRFAKSLAVRPHAHGLEEIFEKLLTEKRLVGILNGIDWEQFNPETYPLLQDIKANYTAESTTDEIINAKKKAKEYLQQKCSLPVNSETPMISMGHRFVSQKNFELLADTIENLMSFEDKLRPQIFIRTWPEPSPDNERFDLWWRLTKYSRKYRFNIAFFEPYDRILTPGHEDLYVDRFLYYAASDLFLMPSAWEPCGMCQMEAMRFGAVPIVSDVGGLGDSVTHFEEDSKEGNGFVLSSWHDPNVLTEVVEDALKLRSNQPEVWSILVNNAMNFQSSISHTVAQYISKLYKV